MNEELDSQLSAMFDDELPQSECELLARRLARDENLKARWGRYAAIGAAIRKEQGIRGTSDVARKVSAALLTEPPLDSAEAPAEKRKAFVSPAMRRWIQPVAGAALAASVAALAIFVLRTNQISIGQPEQSAPLVAQTAGVQEGIVPTSSESSEPDSYTVPQSVEPRAIVPSTDLANYMVAHSEFSTPLSRRNMLSALVASEQGTAGGPEQSEEQLQNGTRDADEAQQ
jgi:sigma-E factor negative regulatory protein RseA